MVPTFYTIYKKKSSEGFQSIPYVVALLSALLLLYYGFLKTNATLIITINCIGIVIEVAYLTMYITYAPKKLKISTLLLILIADIGGIGLTMIITFFVVKGPKRVQAVGFICAIFNIAVFAAPLSIMMILYLIYKNAKKGEANCTEQQEWEGAVKSAQHSCDGNKLDCPSVVVEMKEIQV
ncbi:SWEET sugar transporter [Sesbania bispinosa]|nr:SWEET sugar transporter [Sesbania bispinosa]